MIVDVHIASTIKDEFPSSLSSLKKIKLSPVSYMTGIAVWWRHMVWV